MAATTAAYHHGDRSKSMKRASRRAGLRGRRALPRPDRRARDRAREERGRAARRRRHRRVRHRARRARRRRAAVHRARRPHPRCAQLGRRQGARRRPPASSSSRCCRAPTRTTSPPREIIVPALPDDAAALEDLARRHAAARRQGRSCAPRSAATRPRSLETATLNAKQALMLYKTRRSGRLRGARRRSPTSRRRSAWTRRRCAWSATTSRTSAAPTSSRRWSCSRTACRAKTSTAVQHPRVRPTTPSRSTRCSAAGWRVLEGDEPRRARRRRRAAGRRRSAKQFRLPPAPAHRRRRPAAGRGRRSARSTTPGVTDIPLCGHRQAARGDLAARRRLPGHPAAQQRGAVPAPAHPRRGPPVRDHATSGRSARRDIASQLAEIPGLGPSRVQGAAASTSARSSGCKQRDAGRDRRGEGHRPGPRRPRSSVGWRDQSDSAATTREERDG